MVWVYGPVAKDEGRVGGGAALENPQPEGQ